MSFIGQFPQTRLRRLRQQASLRSLVRETRLHPDTLILPLFIKQDLVAKQAIPTMPGHYQLSLSDLAREIAHITSLGIKNVILFGVPAWKDGCGSGAYGENAIIPQSIRLIKRLAPELLVIADLCFCAYTDHGHCGIMKTSNTTAQLILDNDQTLALLGKQACSYAQAGADLLAPSGMCDGMVSAIRDNLDQAGFVDVPILSYAVKYASALYGPFRDAASGAPAFGDRYSHQLDFANSQEALRECYLDIQEGADMLMVKPAHTYLDIINQVKTQYPLMPLGAYHTSGEYGLLKAAAVQGLIDERLAVLEVLTAIKRAGADFIITYYATEVLKWLS
jgi:porphobilinogen synthase